MDQTCRPFCMSRYRYRRTIRIHHRTTLEEQRDICCS
jgi:hypothetical protein